MKLKCGAIYPGGGAVWLIIIRTISQQCGQGSNEIPPSCTYYLQQEWCSDQCHSLFFYYTKRYGRDPFGCCHNTYWFLHRTTQLVTVITDQIMLIQSGHFDFYALESILVFAFKIAINRADSRYAPSKWKTALLCNDVSYWLGANLESALDLNTYIRYTLVSYVAIFQYAICRDAVLLQVCVWY